MILTTPNWGLQENQKSCTHFMGWEVIDMLNSILRVVEVWEAPKA